MEKICTRCSKIKLYNEFSFKNISKKILQSWCKDCHKKITQQHYLDNRQYYINKSKKSNKNKLAYIRELKEITPCCDCCKKYPHYVMEYDHIDNKYKEVSKLIGSSWKLLKEEIAKCDIVCCNCHAIRTWQRNNIWASDEMADMRI